MLNIFDPRRRQRQFSHKGTGHLAISFSGSGLMMIWQLGVADAFLQKPDFMKRVIRIHGTSGGACVSTVMLTRPDLVRTALAHYTSGDMWKGMTLPRDLTHPHDRLLVNTVKILSLVDEASPRAVSGKLIVHVTPRAFPVTNVGIDCFETAADIVSAVAASCCLTPGGIVLNRHGIGSAVYVDGGFSDPMPHDPILPTVTVSILAGEGVDIAPGRVGSPPGDGSAGFSSAAANAIVPDADAAETLSTRGAAFADRAGLHPFRRYDASVANARAMFDAAWPPSAERAQSLFELGQKDGLKFLRLAGH
jgi:predicted acylesterase/phospholipase RssA